MYLQCNLCKSQTPGQEMSQHIRNASIIIWTEFSMADSRPFTFQSYYEHGSIIALETSSLWRHEVGTTLYKYVWKSLFVIFNILELTRTTISHLGVFIQQEVIVILNCKQRKGMSKHDWLRKVVVTEMQGKFYRQSCRICFTGL